MTYVIIALVVVMLIAIAPFVRRHFRGQRLISSILSGKFDEWPPGQSFAAWFKERPEREEQRKLFVDLALAFRCPSGVIDLSPQRRAVSTQFIIPKNGASETTLRVGFLLLRMPRFTAGARIQLVR
jgi:hypothetical protein